MHKLIFIEGIIGAGKSTLTGALAEGLPAHRIDETVEGNPWLEKFYADPARFIERMQTFCLVQRHAQQQTAIENVWGGDYDHTILDRGVFGDAAFANVHYNKGLLDVEYMHTYRLFRQTMIEQLDDIEKLIIYLDVHPENALRRIARRGRETEKNIDITYLEQLDGVYRDMLFAKSDEAIYSAKNLQIARVDWNHSDPAKQHAEVEGVMGLIRAPKQ